MSRVWFRCNSCTVPGKFSPVLDQCDCPCDNRSKSAQSAISAEIVLDQASHASRSIAVLTALLVALPARAQFDNCINLERVNRRLAGHVVDYTNNHGSDRRIFSPILGMPRDLYVYLPPGYDPGRTYSLVLFFHMADVDEHFFVGSKVLKELEDLIVCGGFPPAIVACPDGTYRGWNRFHAKDSLYVNGLGGRFKDHILQEVVPFLVANYAIRPERQAHALVGFSAGGYGAMGLAIEHRDVFGAVATLASPLNLRYSNCDGVYFEDFDPTTYRWKTTYDPRRSSELLCRPRASARSKVHGACFRPRGCRGRPDHSHQSRRPDLEHQSSAQ